MSAQETVETVPTTTTPANPEPATPEVQAEPSTEVVETEATEEGQERDDKGRFKPNRVQERIDELTRQKGEAAREAAYWRGVAEAAKLAETKPVEDPGKPKADQFQTYDEYTEALTDWKIEQREQKRDAQQRAQATASTWNERATAARQSMPDFDAVLSSSSAPMTKAMAETIQDSEKGPDLAYHLAKNPAEAARIAQLSPLAAARELGKLELSLSAPKAAPRVTNAPTPANPVGSGRSTEGDPGKMSMDDYIVWRQTQLKDKR